MLHLLAGCQSRPEEDIGNGYVRVMNDEGVVTHICQNEQTVGTNFKNRVSRASAEMKEEQATAQRELQRN